ncbi:hypothetical protein [Pandoraea morbifera]|uniref:hypothetical protein n=1 Tax=Pandoraea morbifera TaxID=2508300 RepID=UPI001242822A|nr:hypothetical protein [Pandoraea morbifera]
MENAPHVARHIPNGDSDTDARVGAVIDAGGIRLADNCIDSRIDNGSNNRSNNRSRHRTDAS